MIRLNNNIEIPQIGVGTWTLLGETARHYLYKDKQMYPDITRITELK